MRCPRFVVCMPQKMGAVTRMNGPPLSDILIEKGGLLLIRTVTFISCSLYSCIFYALFVKDDFSISIFTKEIYP